MRLLCALAIFALVAPGIAGAQAPPTTPPPPNAPPPKPAQPNPATLSAEMTATLRKAGFTDLQILPNAIFVRGKDKGGNPVAMVLDPNSMTEVVTLDPHSGSAAGGNGAPTLTGSSTFITVLPSEKLASRLVGTDVTDKQGAKLGTVRDIAIDHGGVHAYILKIGGVLGIGERYVAVAPAAIVLTAEHDPEHLKATMDATVDQMKAAPAFKYGDIDEATK